MGTNYLEMRIPKQVKNYKQEKGNRKNGKAYINIWYSHPDLPDNIPMLHLLQEGNLSDGSAWHSFIFLL